MYGTMKTENPTFYIYLKNKMSKLYSDLLGKSRLKIVSIVYIHIH